MDPRYSFATFEQIRDEFGEKIARTVIRFRDLALNGDRREAVRFYDEAAGDDRTSEALRRYAEVQRRALRCSSL